MAFLTDEELGSLKIEKSVFHIVGPDDEHFLLLQEFDAKAHENFFLGRIRSLNGGNRYTFLSDASVRTKLTRIDKKLSLFQEESEELARAFNSGHRGNSAVGAFLIFTLRCNSGRIFALLKFEDEKVLSYAIKKAAAGGKPKPELGEITRTFVQNRNALQKAALIRLDEEQDKVCVIDRQNPQRPAAYLEQFLGVRRLRNEGELTAKLVELTRQVARKHSESLPKDAMRGLTKRLFDATQSGASVEGDKIDDWFRSIVGPLPDESPILKDFNAYLKREGMSGESFVLDKTVLPAPRNRKVETQSGVHITFPISLQSSVVNVNREKGEITIKDAITFDDFILESAPQARA